MESESFVNNSDLYHFGSFVSPAMQARAQKQQQQVRPFPLLLLCSISFPCPTWLDFSLMTTSFQPRDGSQGQGVENLSEPLLVLPPQQRTHCIEYFEYLSWNWNFNNQKLFVLYLGSWSEGPPRMTGTSCSFGSSKNAKIVFFFLQICKNFELQGKGFIKIQDTYLSKRTKPPFLRTTQNLLLAQQVL